MTETDLIEFLKTYLKLEVEETKTPFDAINCKRVEISLSLKLPDSTVSLGKSTVKIHEKI